MDKTIEFTLIRDVIAPKRANSHDAGTDFYIPNFSEKFLDDLIAKNEKNNFTYAIAKFPGSNGSKLMITVPAGEQINIPSGIKVDIKDKNTYLQANNKSGIATKYHLLVGATIVDADYQGEIHLNVTNVGNEPIVLESGMKIVQFIHQEYIDTDWKEISNEEYDNKEKTDRGAGGFGSTGLK